MKIACLLVSLVMVACAQSESVPGGGGLGGSDAGDDAASGGSSGSATGGSGGFFPDAATGGSSGSGGSGAGPCTAPVSGPCDTFPQCGCNPGERCDVGSTTGETICVADGTVDPFKACSSGSACKVGASCVGNVCKPFCEKSTDCSGGGKCIQVLSDAGGQGTPIPGFKVCTASCSLVNPVAICGTKAGCYPDTETPTGTDCAPAGVGAGADMCTGSDGKANPTACAPGFGCVPGSSASNWDCRKWCRVGFSNDCPGGAACSGFAPPNALFIDAIEYGVCP
ncbi:MAG: hypothetical protein R3B13_19460 [Polyangiaceae bacterium]